MKKINFKQFRLFKDITQTEFTTTDVSRQVAEIIYQNATGVLAHDVALRIYHSEGDVSLSAEEVDYLKMTLPLFTTPLFQDSFVANLKDESDE